MKVLVIGQGGREHAIAWKLAQSSDCKKIFIAPGNGGTSSEEKCENTGIKVTDFSGIKDLIESKQIDLVVVGPEDPLVNGIKDYLSETGTLIFGPDAILSLIHI